MGNLSFLLILGFVLTHCGKANPIYGGILEGKILELHQHQREVNPLKTPYMVFIDVVDLEDKRDVDHIMHTSCGGIIIGARTVLTAAHCIIESAKSPYISIIAGVLNVEAKGKEKPQIIKGEKYITHGGYKEECKIAEGKYELCANDIALIRTVDSFNFRPSIQVAVLAGSRSKQNIEKGWIYGWGMTESDRKSDHLRKALMKVAPLQRCERAYSEIVFNNNYLCLVSDNQKSAACPGDSGGPYVVNGVVYGLFAFSNVFQDAKGAVVGCDNRLPSVYTNIMKYERWIKESVRKLAPLDFKKLLKFDDGSNQLSSGSQQKTGVNQSKPPQRSTVKPLSNSKPSNKNLPSKQKGKSKRPRKYVDV